MRLHSSIKTKRRTFGSVKYFFFAVGVQGNGREEKIYRCSHNIIFEDTVDDFTLFRSCGKLKFSTTTNENFP